MNATAARLLRLGVSLSGLVVLGWVLTGQAAKPAQEGLPTDWSHHHLIFSQPATYDMARRVTSDPRYRQQWYRDNVPRVLPNPATPGDETSMNLGPAGAHNRRPRRDWSENLGSGASVGAGNFPAKYAFQINSASCSDYVVFTTGLAGSSTKPSVVGYTNLYSGCGGTVPTLSWAYNTGGQILTSPVISEGGLQVAFVQTASSQGTLVLLKWAASSGTMTSPLAPTLVSTTSYQTCTAPCMTTIPLQDGLGFATDDTTSSVFPDYSNDIIWVGDASGWLHQMTGVFRGTPAELTTGGFPVHVNSGSTLSSPVYDRISGNVFVGDYGGYLYSVTTAPTPVVTQSARLDYGTGLVSGPIVDTAAGKVYVFSSSDGTIACTGSVPCSAVYLFSTGFAAGTTGAEAAVGVSAVAPNPMYEGGFDSTYRASVNATGNLYVCGNTGGIPTLYQIPITAGVMGTVLTGGPLSGVSTGCSPVTDVSNPNAAGGIAEWIFASVQAGGLGNNCPTGCMMNFNVQPWLPSHIYTVGQEILDSNLNVQVVRRAGTSRTAALGHPTWNTVTDGNTFDATVRWTNQGTHNAAYPSWQPSLAYPPGNLILDTNNNVEWVLTPGTSGTAAPVWSVAINGATIDGTVQWRNLGAAGTSSLAVAGGASGIIIDNTVGSGTMPGGSQIYFSTQGNQPCVTSGGTGGCAVQASQPGLN